jgi:hypothetical protein
VTACAVETTHAIAQSRRNTRRKVPLARDAQSPSSIGQSAFGEGTESPSRTGVTREARVLPNPRKSVLARRQSPSSPRRVFDGTGIVSSSGASGSRKSVSASSRNPQAGSPRSAEEDPVAATGSERASRIEKISCIGSRRHQSATTTCNGGEDLALKDVNYRANVAIAG